MDKETQIFIDYLKTILIPDLRKSGMTSTAEDFEKCVYIIKTQGNEINSLTSDLSFYEGEK